MKQWRDDENVCEVYFNKIEVAISKLIGEEISKTIPISNHKIIKS
jgi:hypothetical protein